MAVRQHLYSLQNEKLVMAEERPVPLGRPAKYWQLTREDAEQYCWSQAQQIVNGEGWVVALALWQAPGYAAGLAGLALDDEAA